MRLDLNDSNLQTRLKQLAARAHVLCAGPLGESVHKFLTEMGDSLGDAKKIADRNEFLAKAVKDPVVMQELRAIRVEQFNNYVLASQNIANMFFENVALADDERPVHQNETMQEVRVTYVGQDGQPGEAKIVKPQSETLIDLHQLTTDEVNYRKFDVYRGNIADAALATIKLAYDMANQRDARCKALLDSALGAFTFTGSKANWSYVPNSRIVTANLPATNDITVPDKNSTGKFRFEVFKAAKKYGGQWGSAFMDGPLMPTGRILVPSLDASDIADEIVPSGATSNKVADDLLENGWSQIGYLGKNWTLVEDNTLAAGSCYAEFNRKPGRAYSKPQFDKEYVDDGYENTKRNRESRFMTSVFGAYVNSMSRAFFCRLNYA